MNAAMEPPANTPLPAPARREPVLDWVRGFAMFFICGGGTVVLTLAACFPKPIAETVRTQLTHVSWEGFRFEDLIFPTFLLVSGAAFTFAWRRQRERGLPAACRWGRLFVRTAALILLGIVYNGGLEQTSLAAVRFPSVLARIGLGVLLAAIPYVALPQRFRWLFFPIGLALYGTLFHLCGGASPYANPNWSVRVDNALLPGKLWGSPDPEGVVSTFGALFTAYLGMLLGDFLHGGTRRKALWMAAAGVMFIAAAYTLSPWVPVVKKLWTASYVCLAGGWTLLVCAAFQAFSALPGRVTRWLGGLAFIGTHALWFYLLPRFFDFGHAANLVVGGPIRAHLGQSPWCGFLLALAAFLALWLTVRLLRPRPRGVL